MCIPISIRTSNTMADIKGLVDLGATDCFMSPAFIQCMRLGTRPLQKPKRIWNIDNTANKDGLITHYIDLKVQTKGVHRTIQFLVTNIGNEDLVLGYPWLATFKPQFNWASAVINEKALPVIIRSMNPQIPSQDPIITGTQMQDSHLQATTSTELAIKAQQYTTKAEVPTPYHKFSKIFSKEESKCYPPK